MSFARYKNRAAYGAVPVEVEVDERIKISRVWCAAADTGLVINPDGAINQLEGGIISGSQLGAEGTGQAGGDWRPLA